MSRARRAASPGRQAGARPALRGRPARRATAAPRARSAPSTRETRSRSRARTCPRRTARPTRPRSSSRTALPAWHFSISHVYLVVGACHIRRSTTPAAWVFRGRLDGPRHRSGTAGCGVAALDRGNHALVDGNKRLAWSASRVFCLLNGRDLELGVDEAEAMIVGAARAPTTSPRSRSSSGTACGRRERPRPGSRAYPEIARHDEPRHVRPAGLDLGPASRLDLELDSAPVGTSTVPASGWGLAPRAGARGPSGPGCGRRASPRRPPRGAPGRARGACPRPPRRA